MEQRESLEGLKVHRVANVLWERPNPLKRDPQTKNPGPQKFIKRPGGRQTKATWRSTNHATWRSSPILSDLTVDQPY